MAVDTGLEQQLSEIWEDKPGLRSWFSTVDHKRIGHRYLVTGFVFFVIGGLEALAMRMQLAVPQNTLIGPQGFNELFSFHGTTMIFFFITPLLSGFSNYFIPMMIGARDMAFPRLNAFSYWVFLCAGIFLYASVPAGQMPDGGWFAYAPYTTQYSVGGLGMDFWALSLIFLSISTTAGAINLIVTILKMRAPGMTLARLPLFGWAIMATSWMMVFALPPLTVANILLEGDRNLGTHFYDAAAGGSPLLWQHLFWLFGHPDVYIIFLPAVGIVSTIVGPLSRRAIVGYPLVALATVATAILGFGVWVHHMFATGLPQMSLTFFSAASMVITIPSAIQIFAWITTIIRGRPVFATPFLFAVGFIVVFVIGGVTGVMFAAVPFDQQVTDSYFVVAHFHYVLFGGAVFPVFAGLHYWFPKMSGRMYDERLGRLTFWLVFIGFNVTFFPMHIVGLLGMPRRVYTYLPDAGYSGYNMVETIGSFVLGVGILVFMVNVAKSLRSGRAAGRDPWAADSLEWSTSSPPPPYNFAEIPRVTSRHPLWEQPSITSDLVLAEERLALGSSALDADPEVALPMPKETAVPLLMALLLTAAFAGLLLGVIPLLAVAVVGAMACAAVWNWRNGGNNR